MCIRDRSRRELYSFGYAYPFISRETAEQTLPFLTDLYIFSYGFTEQGTLIPPPSDDTWLIRQAADAGVDPVMVLTPLGADGRFNNNLVTALMEDRRLQERLIWELGRTMTEKGYRGLDIDFEYVRAEDGPALSLIHILSVIFSEGIVSLPALLPFAPEFHMGAIFSVAIIFMVSAAETIGDTTAMVSGGLGREITSKEISGSLACDEMCIRDSFYTFIIHCHGIPCNRSWCSAHMYVPVTQMEVYTNEKEK